MPGFGMAPVIRSTTSPLWNNMKTKAKNERIYNEGKDKLDGTGIEIIEEKGDV